MASQHSPLFEYEDTSSEEEMSDLRYDEPLPERQRPVLPTENKQKTVRRRGRGPSKQPSLNRNAQMARANRERKKKYVEELEHNLKKFKEKAENYNNIIRRQNINQRRLISEVAYLKNILRHKGSISMLLQSINENLKNKRTNQEVMNSNHKQRVAFPKEQMKPFLEDFKLKSENGHVHSETFEDLADPNRIEAEYGKTSQPVVDNFLNLEDLENYYTSPLLSAGEGPFLNSDQNFENLLPITPISIDDTSERSQSLQDDLYNISNLPSIDNIDVFDTPAQLDEASTLDFGTQPNPFLNDGFFDNPDNLAQPAGICLHVNPNRVTLEFCSSCQMNSLHSEID